MTKPTQPIFAVKTCHSIDSFALAKFIAETYGLDDFEATLESGNDTTHEFNVVDKLDEWDEEDLKKYVEEKGCTYWGLGTVMNDLCRRGHIPAGNWLVRVCW